MKKANMNGFYVENYTKENNMRTKWFLRNKTKLETMAELPKKYKDIRTAEVMKLPIIMCMPNLTAHHKTYAVNRRKKPLRDGIIRVSGKDLKSESVTLEPIMKPVDPEVQKILCQDAPHGGRCIYLKHRELLKPEDRYNECMSQNTAYGWHSQDSKNVKSVHGRYFVFEHDLVSRKAPHIRDPDHYKEPTKDITFCEA